MSQCLTKTEAVAALRAAADLIDNLADTGKYWYVQAGAYNLTAEQLAAAARTGGKWDKDTAGPNGSMFQLRQGMVELHAERDEVCTAVPTGRKVTVKKLVGTPVYEDVEVDEVEWDCGSLLARAES